MHVLTLVFRPTIRMSCGELESLEALVAQQWECCSVSCDCVCAMTLTDLFAATDVSQCAFALVEVMNCNCCAICSDATTKSLAERIVQSQTAQRIAVVDDVPNVEASSEVHECSICNETFCKRANLLRHRATVHSQGTRHVCSICKQTFSRVDSLARHHARKHE